MSRGEAFQLVFALLDAVTQYRQLGLHAADLVLRDRIFGCELSELTFELHDCRRGLRRSTMKFLALCVVFVELSLKLAPVRLALTDSALIGPDERTVQMFGFADAPTNAVEGRQCCGNARVGPQVEQRVPCLGAQ
ncbi:hypothetical protein A33M_1351 [Rhodovulum sp. PH10]|nr:hypothetical protein A33M_1351 [Rhodovulum sp. PH10]